MHLRIAASAAALLLLSTPPARAEWQVPATPASTSESQSQPALVADGHGGAFLAFLSREPGASVRLSHYQRNGELAPGWPEGGLPVSAASLRAPALASDERSGVFIGWTEVIDDPDPRRSFHLQRYMGNGRIAPGWPEGGVAIAAADLSTDEVRLVPDGRGGAIVVIGASGVGSGPIFAQRVGDRGELLWGAEPIRVGETTQA